MFEWVYVCLCVYACLFICPCVSVCVCTCPSVGVVFQYQNGRQAMKGDRGRCDIQVHQARDQGSFAKILRQSLQVTYFESLSVFRTYIEFIFLRIPHHPNTWWLDSMQIWWEMDVWYWNFHYFRVDLINTDCCKDKYLLSCRSSHFGRSFRGMSFLKNFNAYCICICLQKCLNTSISMH